MKRGCFLAVLLCTAMTLTGCRGLSSGFSPEVSGISISKKGAITEVVREDFTASYYNADELKYSINSAIQDYNTNSGRRNAVKQKKISFKNGIAELTMSYASASDYAAFNQVDYYQGDVVGAVSAGNMFEGNFTPVVDGVVTEGTAVFGSQLISGPNYATVIVNGPMLVKVPGNLVYVTEGVKVTDKSTAVAENSGKAYVLYE